MSDKELLVIPNFLRNQKNLAAEYAKTDQAYTEAVELERTRVALFRQQLDIGESHLRQLSNSVVMDRKRLRDTEASLAQIETLYAQWKELTANILHNRLALESPSEERAMLNEMLATGPERKDDDI